MNDREVFVIALADPVRNEQARSEMQRQFPEAEILTYPGADRSQLVKASALLVWQPDPELWAQVPNLAFVQSYGAGVDHLASHWDQLSQIPVARFVDPELSQNLSRYVISHILDDQLQGDRYRAQQQQSLWQSFDPRPGNRVLVLGLGVIGCKVAEDLVVLGYQVSGWSRTPKAQSRYATLAGLEPLQSALSEADYVVNLLPLTEDTRQIVNARLLVFMSSDCCFINGGRGATVDSTALVHQLDQGLLRKAVLDVFEQEPLPQDHTLWQHPKVIVTPHIASISNIQKVVDLFAENQRRCVAGTPILHVVDKTLGY